LDSSTITPATGHAYYVAPNIQPALGYDITPDTVEDAYRSRAVLLEDGRVLGPAHTSHNEIRQQGNGRYSHWGEGVYLSSSDNSDPRTNGREYVLSFPLQIPEWLYWVLAASVALLYLTLGSSTRLVTLYAAASGTAALWAYSTLVGIYEISPVHTI